MHYLKSDSLDTAREIALATYLYQDYVAVMHERDSTVRMHKSHFLVMTEEEHDEYLKLNMKEMVEQELQSTPSYLHPYFDMDRCIEDLIQDTNDDFDTIFVSEADLVFLAQGYLTRAECDLGDIVSTFLEDVGADLDDVYQLFYIKEI